MESKFFQTQKFQPLVWIRYTDDSFFSWTHGANSLKQFMTEFDKFNPNINFTYEFIEESINFLDLNVKLLMVNFRPPCM